MRKILIVIDMQNDFIDMALGTKEAVAVVDEVKKKIRSYSVKDVMATMDTHEENYLKTQEGELLPVEHCIRGTVGWQLHPEIAPLLDGAEIYEKPGFGSVRLAQDLKALSGTEEIELELIGLCTDICVHAGGENHGRFRLLCRRDPGKTPRGIGNHAFLPDQCGLKRGMHSIPGLWR